MMQKEGKVVKLPGWFAPTNFSPAICSLLVRLIHPEPSMRLSATQALLHPWCKSDKEVTDEMLLVYNTIEGSSNNIRKANSSSAQNSILAIHGIVGVRNPLATTSSYLLHEIPIPGRNLDSMNKDRNKSREGDSRNLFPPVPIINSISNHNTANLNSSLQQMTFEDIVSDVAPGDAIPLAAQPSHSSMLDNSKNTTHNSAKPDGDRQASPNRSTSTSLTDARLDDSMDRRLVQSRSQGGDQERKEQEYLSRLTTLVSCSTTPTVSPQSETRVADSTHTHASSQIGDMAGPRTNHRNA